MRSFFNHNVVHKSNDASASWMEKSNSVSQLSRLWLPFWDSSIFACPIPQLTLWQLDIAMKNLPFGWIMSLHSY
jgi:hypothetical protein